MTKPGDKIKVLFMKGEPEYTGREGIITNSDSLGQMHGKSCRGRRQNRPKDIL